MHRSAVHHPFDRLATRVPGVPVTCEGCDKCWQARAFQTTLPRCGLGEHNTGIYRAQDRSAAERALTFGIIALRCAPLRRRARLPRRASVRAPC